MTKKARDPQEGWNAKAHDPEWPFDILATDFTLHAKSTALLIVDMQANALEYPPTAEMAKRYPKIAAYYNERIAQVAVPNTRRLLDCFRAHQAKTVYTRNGKVTSTGEELAPRLKMRGKGKRTDPASLHGIDPRIPPREEDLVIDKLTSGAFTASFLDHALRNMNVKSVVITGVVTDMCVFGTARAAAELGYDSLICEDACAAMTERSHIDALLMHARTFGRVATTKQIIAEMDGRN